MIKFRCICLNKSLIIRCFRYFVVPLQPKRSKKALVYQVENKQNI